MNTTLAGLVAILLIAGPSVETRADAIEETVDWLNSIGVKYGRKEWTPELARKAYSVNLTRARKFNPKHMSHLAAMPRLRSLNIGHQRFGDEELAAAVKLDRLTSLTLSRASVTTDGLSKITGMRSLRRLSLSGTPLGSEAMVHVAKLTGLTSLDLNDTTLGDAGLEHLKTLPRLRRLSLSSAKGITAKGLAAVAQMPNLSSLNLQFVKINTEIGALAGSKTLTHLTMMRSNLDDDGAIEIAKIRSLERLVIWKTRITDKGAAAIATLPHLKTLIISGTDITDAGLKSIARIKTLRTLWMRRLKIGDKGIAYFRGHPELRWIIAGNTRVSDASLEVFLSMPKLRNLGLRKSHVTGAGVDGLKAARPKLRVSF
ncbi:MAG: leucine-rich repeat domain-containing protein [Alphaproteobacteria bacterium]